MDYKNGKIYKLICSETQKIYIGSTCSTLSKRLYGHKAKLNRAVSRNFVNPKIYLIEDYPCERKEQLLMRERFFIESLDCINKKLPIVENRKESDLKYIKNNKERIKEAQQKYLNNNKEFMEQIKKKSYEKNKDKYHLKKNIKNVCECGGKFTNANKSQHLKSKKHKLFCETIKQHLN